MVSASGRKATQNLNQTWQHRRIWHTYSTRRSCDQFLRLVQQNTDRPRPGRPRPRGVEGWGSVWEVGDGTQIKTCRSIQRLQRCRSAPIHSTDASSVSKLVNMVLNVHRNHKAYQGRGEWGKGGMEVGDEGEYIPIATLSPPE